MPLHWTRIKGYMYHDFDKHLQRSRIQDLESKSSANLLPVVDMVIQGANSWARVLGNFIAQLTIAQWHVWLNQSRLADADRVTVVKDAIIPGEGLL